MTDDPGKLANQPLTMVLAEFCYSPVLKIDAHIPDIQEQIRQSYPVLSTTEQQSVEVAGPEIKISNTSQWVFSSHDRRRVVIISTDRLIFATSIYDRFPGFSDSCLGLLSTLKEIVNPALLVRIGLRYNDHIAIEQVSELAKIVDSNMLPNPELTALGTSINNHREETSIQTTEGTLQLRSLLGRHELVVMPDLQTLPVTVDKKCSANTLSLLLDFDHSWIAENTGIKFELASAKKHLDSLHGIARDAFWKVTTQHARDKLWT